MADIHVVVVEDNSDLAFMVSQEIVYHEPDAVVTRIMSDFDRIFDPVFLGSLTAAVVDIMLPNADGRDILHRLAVEAPWVRRVAWSAMPKEILGEIDAHVILQKPGTMRELMEAIRGA